MKIIDPCLVGNDAFDVHEILMYVLLYTIHYAM